MDFVCAEDTRVGRQLLTLLGLPGPARGWVSLHAHNEAEASHAIVDRLLAGESAALISDAGTPAIADPGSRLVAEAHRQGIRVVPIPGPSALTALLSASGFQPQGSGTLRFLGFVPSRAKARDDWLAPLRSTDDVCVFFEAPHRMPETLEALAQVLGPDRSLAMGRELTKQFESILVGSVAEVRQRWAALQARDPGAAKGEFVLALGPSERPGPAEAIDGDGWLEAEHCRSGRAWVALVAEAMPPAAGAKLLAKALGCSRDAAYAALLKATR